MPYARHHRVSVLILILLLSAFVATAYEAGPGSAPPEPPVQPLTGPGGNAPSYDGLLAQHFGPDPASAAVPTGYWLFEPTQPRSGIPSLTESRLPLVLFGHAFRGGDPELYHAWIAHLVRRGAIVVYPDYQLADPVNEATLTEVGQTASALFRTAVRDALTELTAAGHARPDLTRVAVVGHSLGAVLAADYAGTAAQFGLPVPRVAMLAMPACRRCDLASLAAISPTTRVLIVVGDETDEDVARAMWAGLAGVPPEQRDYVRLRSDRHGDPPLIADHAQPATGLSTSVDAFDWYGTWKLLDAIMSCAFDGRWCDHALGNMPAQRFMGAWSDGAPVVEPKVTDNPGASRPRPETTSEAASAS